MSEKSERTSVCYSVAWSITLSGNRHSRKVRKQRWHVTNIYTRSIKEKFRKQEWGNDLYYKENKKKYIIISLSLNACSILIVSNRLFFTYFRYFRFRRWWLPNFFLTKLIKMRQKKYVKARKFYMFILEHGTSDIMIVKFAPVEFLAHFEEENGQLQVVWFRLKVI